MKRGDGTEEKEQEIERKEEKAGEVKAGEQKYDGLGEERRGKKIRL